MQHLAQHKAAAACTTSLLVTSLAAFDSSPAYALSPDDVQKFVTSSQEFVQEFVSSSREFVLSSHWATFGVGCACGAVVGGLVFGVIGRRRNHKLRIELEELRMSATMHPGSMNPNDIEGTQSRKPAEQAQSQDQPSNTAAETPPSEARSDEPHRSASPSSTVAIPKSQFGPRARASYIDHCIARFDESLYPDTSNPVAHDADAFETAMRAMEDSLRDSESFYASNQDYSYAFTNTETPSTEQAPSISTFTSTSTSKSTSADEFDVKAYIERIMQDEIERSRNPQKKGYTHDHLTVYDGAGTNDLVVTRKIHTYVPRHMRADSKGA